ncbi:MAG: hypothetical protein AAFV59_04700 [Pseudomonadota bacterium]
MWMKFVTLGLLLSLGFATGLVACAKDLPNQRAVLIEDFDGKKYLEGWSARSPTSPKMYDRYAPDNPVFQGAETWKIPIEDGDLRRGTLSAFRLAGMKAPKIIAFAYGNPAAMDVLDSHPDANMASVMVEGRINGAVARGIAINIFGSSTTEPPTTATVQAFMAPKPAFEALGGMAVPGVWWFLGVTSPDENMLEDGRLPPDEAVTKLNGFFAAWIEHYIVPLMSMTMQMQMQSIQNMQSWNNAMNACSGDPGCSVVPMNDGSGGWTAQQQ